VADHPVPGVDATTICRRTIGWPFQISASVPERAICHFCSTKA
jgi:hypothetical protein